MDSSVLTALIEFAVAHPWIVAARFAILIALVAGIVSYRRMYRASIQAAAENAALIDNLTEGVYRSSPDGQQLSANRALVKLNGYDTETEMLASVGDIGTEWYVDPKRRAEFQSILAEDGRVENFVSEIYRHKTRERIWISESARTVHDPKTGDVIRYEGSVREVTDSIRRREIEERFRKLTDMLPGGLFQLVRDADGVFSAPYVTSGFCRTVGIEETDNVDDPLSYFNNIDPADRESYVKSLRESGRNLSTWNTEFRITDQDEQTRWLHVVAQPEKSGKTITWHGYISDVSVRKQQELEIEEMAFVDPLTGLPNRRVLMDRLAQAVSDCKRRSYLSAALFVDLDHFKHLNDTHGHETGDMFLVKVAERLQDAVRGGDTVARIGGDEFVLLLNSIGTDDQSARENALAIAEKILGSLRKSYRLGKLSYKSTASLGAVIFDGSVDNVEQILNQADQAMYEAKTGGRDTVGTLFVSSGSADQESEADVTELALELDSAIKQRELFLRFQPQVDRKGALVGAEGFLCWNHPERGNLRSKRLLQIAKAAGLATDLDLVAMEIAVETLAIWSRTPGLETVRLAVNAGASFMLDERAPGVISGLIEQHRIRPGMLTIEITEQVHRSARTSVESRMAALRSAGVRFSLDDFGSGYSSITYLKQLNFDEVKIEGSFVAGIDGNEDNEALVKTILAMADTLGVTAVAEHVESESQQAFLRAYGCDIFQGRFYADAMDGEAFAKFAETNLEKIEQEFQLLI